jgi:hypothetical protein
MGDEHAVSVYLRWNVWLSSENVMHRDDAMWIRLREDALSCFFHGCAT